MLITLEETCQVVYHTTIDVPLDEIAALVAEDYPNDFGDATSDDVEEILREDSSRFDGINTVNRPDFYDTVMISIHDYIMNNGDREWEDEKCLYSELLYD